MSDYEALKAYGHSPAKAAEIALDAKRGNLYCQRWISLVRASATEGESAVAEGETPTTPIPSTDPELNRREG